MNVSIFGGSQVQPGSSAYEEARELGRLLALAGHTVLTGGYIGFMEAVSRGANEAGGHVVGVTCSEIEAWRPIRANGWVKEERKTGTLFERLQTLIDGCDAAIGLPGGPGTLAEIALTWNLMIIDACRRQLLLVGKGWEEIFQRMFEAQAAYVPQGQRAMLRFAPDCRSAVNMLESTTGALNAPWSASS
jgi:hypothetical protein